ncbi:MAG TPA: tetratricopeptide repeat protein [Tepidisphaeraceae bacterium]|nr:tetratricopeptide repeat protein [Tepidisphaeraceae bacterium]
MSVMPALNQALELSRRGDHASAERICRQIVAAQPGNAKAWCHIGTCCLTANRLKEAGQAYEQALRAQPHFPEALNNLAVVHSRLNRVEQAAALFKEAINQRPNWAEPFISLGHLYTNNDRLDDAAQAFRSATLAEPRNAEAHNLLGSVLARMGVMDQARQRFSESIRLNPRYETAHSNLLLALNYDTKITSKELMAEHEWFDRLHGQGLMPVAPHLNLRDPNRPLRVGYVSPDLRRHAVAWFMLPVFLNHDPKQVQVFGYAQASESDAIAEQFRSRCVGWRVTVGRTDAQIAEQARADGIDILVDLAGHTGGNRLGAFGYRPAPVQVTYLGYPNTTGMSAIHYRLTDAVADPPGEERCHTEELVRLPGTFCCFAPPVDVPDVADLPSIANGYVTFGLLHKMSKFNAPMLDVWAAVMNAVPGSRLLGFRNTMDRSVRDRWTREFGNRGISADRLILENGSVKDGVHLTLYNKIDISLDALPWSGHATTCESMWMGVPMVTLRGTRHSGRMSASILTALDMPQLIAETPEQFVQIASELAKDRSRLAKMRSELRGRMQASTLCDAAGFTRRLETAYREMCRRWCESTSR